MVQTVMNEALKYEGFPYVFGGANPNTSFDCSGLTQWVYRKAGIELPRTAQQQYEATEYIPLSEAKPGDLIFFHSTYKDLKSTRLNSSHVATSYAVFGLKK